MSTKQHQTTVLVTGATRGIGQNTTKLLVDNGFLVIVHGRDESAARAACARLGTPESLIPVWGDLADLKQVCSLANQVLKDAPILDGVILNAGVFQPGELTSADGFELDFAVNYLSHLLLMHLLLDRLLSAPEARVIFVSSSAYINGFVDLAHFGAQYMHDPLKGLRDLQVALSDGRSGTCPASIGEQRVCQRL